MSDEEIAAWIENHAGRGISPERLRFWEAILPLPRGKVDRWIAASRAESWGRRLAR
ncbi:MAG: hypothetical protein HY704_05315 [Gemmatimonadetes bacterium]|nr:hypothetical protein [Gemmatimonadota bacterium]